MWLVWLTSAMALGLLWLRYADRWRRFRQYQRTIDRIPGSRNLPLLGTTYTFFNVGRDNFSTVVEEEFRKYPRLSRDWLGPFQAIVHLRRAEHMEIVLGSSTQHTTKSWSYGFLRPWLGEGLLTAGGEHWRKHRKIITPTFHFDILQSFVAVFAEHSHVLAGKLESLADGGDQVVDVYPLVAFAALDIVAEAAMGCQVHAQIGHNHQYVSAISEFSELLLQRILRPWLYSDNIYSLTSSGQRNSAAIKTLHAFTNGVIAERRQALSSKSPDSSASPANRRLAFLDVLLSCPAGQLSADDIREEVDTFMFEGHDTTTAGVVWTMLMLGLHPDWQERVHAECAEIFDDGRQPTMADATRMSVLERVIKESMRLYPPVPNIGRCTTEDIQLDGFAVPAGTTALLEIMHLHRDERYFPRPEEFDPDRFLAAASKDRHPFAYLPFSAGSRNCIGQKFALLEEKVLLSTLVRRLKWRTTVGRRDDVPYVYELVTRPVGGVPLVFERRQ